KGRCRSWIFCEIERAASSHPSVSMMPMGRAGGRAAAFFLAGLPVCRDLTASAALVKMRLWSPLLLPFGRLVDPLALCFIRKCPPCFSPGIILAVAGRWKGRTLFHHEDTKGSHRNKFTFCCPAKRDWRGVSDGHGRGMSES